MEIKNNVFVVSGAGSGIGREIVLQLLNHGALVAACARTQKGLEETKHLAGVFGKNMKEYVFDVSNLDQVQEFVQKVLTDFGRIDGLINNAGIGQNFATISNISYEEIKKVMDVNFYGTLYMTKTILPHFLENKTKSSIVNMSSMAGFIPFPRQSIYASSKGAIKMFSEALYAELRQTNVSVSAVFPGAVITRLTKNAEKQLNSEGKKPYEMLTANKVGKLVIKAIKKEKFKIVAGTDAKLLNFLYRLNPKFAIDILLKNMKGIFKD